MIFLLACGEDDAPPPRFEDQVIDAGTMSRAFSAASDAAGWGADLHAVLVGHRIPATNGNACQVSAIVAQESSYSANPAVPGIGKLIDAWIDEKQAAMGKVQGWAFATGLRTVLDGHAEGESRSWNERLHAAKTERDVDRTYRAFVADKRGRLWKPLRAAESAVAFAGLDLEDWNPITTAGCMQVKVDFAEDHARDDGLDVAGVRDALYTRAGCLHYGAIRLLAEDDGYPEPRYRFADYNAGRFSSRNAAFQDMVATLSGAKLARDGDLLRYDGDSVASEPSQTLQALLALAPGLQLSAWRVEHDLAREKTAAFTETDTWAAVVAAVTAKTGQAPATARLPDVTLESLKLSRKRTTAWFAESVERRYEACIAALKGR